MKISEWSTFVENFDMELQDGVPGSCVCCCFSVTVTIIDTHDGLEAACDAENVVKEWISSRAPVTT